MQEHNNCKLGSWQRHKVEAEGLDRDKTVIIWQHVLASVSCELQDGWRNFAGVRQSAERIRSADWPLCACTVSAAPPDSGRW